MKNDQIRLRFSLPSNVWAHWQCGLGEKDLEEVFEEGLKSIVNSTKNARALITAIHWITPDSGPRDSGGDRGTTATISVVVPGPLWRKSLLAVRKQTCNPRTIEDAHLLFGLISQHPTFDPDDQDPDRMKEAIFHHGELMTNLKSVRIVPVSNRIKIGAVERVLAGIVAFGALCAGLESALSLFQNIVE